MLGVEHLFPREGGGHGDGHEYYEEHGLYDFLNVDPDANKFSLEMIEAIKDPEAKEMIRKMIKSQMVEPHKKVVETK